MSARFRDGSAAAPSPRPLLLLVNLGTPAAPTAAAVRRYLAQFLHDHRVVELTRWLWCPLLHFLILPLRAPRLAKKYAEIWTPQGSPLLAYSRALADAVQARLPGADVRLAMRYGEPAIGAGAARGRCRGRGARAGAAAVPAVLGLHQRLGARRGGGGAGALAQAAGAGDAGRLPPRRRLAGGTGGQRARALAGARPRRQAAAVLPWPAAGAGPRR